MKSLLILGAGQYGMVAKEIAEATGLYDRIAFLDDNSSAAIGRLSDFDKCSDVFDSAVVAIGDAEKRLKLIERLIGAGYDVPVLIHPRAYVASSATINMGCFIEPMAVVHTDVVIGTGCIISACTIVNHNAVIGEGCHLNCGTIVGARVNVPACAKTDCGQIIHQIYKCEGNRIG
jgi:UDP-3-O-[3-hydroxymyristoyl] glucosamine N-acyltransferase